MRFKWLQLAAGDLSPLTRVRAMSRLILKSGKRTLLLRAYAAFVVWARCAFDEVAFALRTASAAWRSGSCL